MGTDNPKILRHDTSPREKKVRVPTQLSAFPSEPPELGLKVEEISRARISSHASPLSPKAFSLYFRRYERQSPRTVGNAELYCLFVPHVSSSTRPR